jgi:hypothetical protein
MKLLRNHLLVSIFFLSSLSMTMDTLAKPRRQQVTRACTNCQRSHHACDNNTPCDLCQKRCIPAEHCIRTPKKERETNTTPRKRSLPTRGRYGESGLDGGVTATKKPVNHKKRPNSRKRDKKSSTKRIRGENSVSETNCQFGISTQIDFEVIDLPDDPEIPRQDTLQPIESCQPHSQVEQDPTSQNRDEEKVILDEFGIAYTKNGEIDFDASKCLDLDNFDSDVFF